MLLKAQAYSSATPYLIMIDIANCKFGVYKGSYGNWSQVYKWDCSPGRPWTPTPKGQFSITGKGYSFGSGYTCYYWSQFYGDYLIHSSPYYVNSNTILDPTMGSPSSAGCVRLTINNALWVYENIPYYTKVVTY